VVAVGSGGGVEGARAGGVLDAGGVHGGGAGADGLELRASTGGRGGRGAMPERADGVAGRVAAGSGVAEGERASDGSDGGGVARARLYSRQHVGQRHSTTSEPSASL